MWIGSSSRRVVSTGINCKYEMIDDSEMPFLEHQEIKRREQEPQSLVSSIRLIKKMSARYSSQKSDSCHSEGKGGMKKRENEKRGTCLGPTGHSRGNEYNADKDPD